MGRDLYVKPASGVGREELLLTTSHINVANDWSPDGHFLLYTSVDSKSVDASLWALPMDGDRPSTRSAGSGSTVSQVEPSTSPGRPAAAQGLWGQFSPDGKWVAYTSSESGRSEIYVQPFPGPGAKSLISTTGGMSARWRPDGKELFYVALDDRLMAVPIRLASDGQAVEAGTPVPLFATRVGSALQQIANSPQYVVAPDGQRFLMNTVVEDANTSPITVILNWKAKP